MRASLLLLCALGCAPRDVVWESERRTAGMMLPGATLVLLDGGVPAMRPAWTPVRWPDDSTACDGTRIAARARGDTAFALWWTRATSGAARLVVSRSDDGGINWRAADTVGGAAGVRDPRDLCRRPPPGLAVDSGTGGLLIVYHGDAAGRAGVLLVRYPVAAGRPAAPALLAEGATTGVASVAIAGDTIVAAFEAPEPDDLGVRLAISSVSGDIPGIQMAVSAAGIRALAPAVAIRDGRVAVAWNEGKRADAGPGAVARVGRIAR